MKDEIKMTGKQLELMGEFARKILKPATVTERSDGKKEVDGYIDRDLFDKMFFNDKFVLKL